MILALTKNTINVVQNSLENIENAVIYLDFKDFPITNEDVIKVYFNDKELRKLEGNTFRVDPTAFNKKLLEVKVIVYNPNKDLKTYTRRLNLHQYFSFGKQGHEKIPQVILDINERIQELEQEILDLKKEINVI